MKIIFLHIPKTAGTTINAVLLNNFKFSRIFSFYDLKGITPDEFDVNCYPKLNSYDLIQGHFKYGIDKLMGSQAYSYMTFLRDPRSRIRSAYSFQWKTKLRAKRSKRRAEIARQLSFHEFCEKVADNLYVRILGNFGNDVEKIEEEHFQIALDNLKSFDFVGITENMDKSLQILQQTFQFKVSLPGKRFMKSGNSFQNNDSLAIPEDKIKFDLKLYEYALTWVNNKQTTNEKITELTKSEEQLQVFAYNLFRVYSFIKFRILLRLIYFKDPI